MGAGNVKTVYAVWGHLPDPAFRLLVFMALTSKDDDERPVYWGGQESLALGVGRMPPHTAADARAVDRAMGKLREAGAISRTRHSAPGMTARHDLHLTHDAARRVSDAVENLDTRRGVTGEHPTPGDVNTRRGVTEHPTRGDRTPDAPRRVEEEQEPLGLTSGVDGSRPAYVAERVPARRQRGRSLTNTQSHMALVEQLAEEERLAALDGSPADERDVRFLESQRARTAIEASRVQRAGS